MEHIRVEQNNVAETIDSNVITSLYNADLGGLDATSTYKGFLYSPSGYQRLVEYLNTKYKGSLVIQCDKLYMEFEDSAVEKVCAAYLGDGIGCTQSDLENSTSFNPSKDGVTLFKAIENAGGTKFNEFKYFTGGSDTIIPQTFSNSTITDLTLPVQVVYLKHGCFENLTSLRRLVVPGKVKSVGEGGSGAVYSIMWNTNIGIDEDGTLNGFHLDFSNCDKIFSNSYMFKRGLTGDVILKSGIWDTPTSFLSFARSNVTKIVFPRDFNCTTMDMGSNSYDNSLPLKMIFLGDPPANYSEAWPTSLNRNGGITWYVPDDKVSAFTTTFGDRSFYTLSEYANISEDNKDELVSYGCTVTGVSGNYVITA